MILLTSNTKTDKPVNGYVLRALQLAPAKTAGRDVCPYRTPGCTAACIFTSGHGQMANVQNARIARTHLFFRDRVAFLGMLHGEIYAIKQRLTSSQTLAIRLNCFSDIRWEKVAPSLFEAHRDVQFYDYTKDADRFDEFLGKMPGATWNGNYHLTFSRSERTPDAQIRFYLRWGGNVAVPFMDQTFPTKGHWKGWPWVDGDQHDATFLHPPGVIVALRAKGKGKQDKTGFVIR